MLLGFVFLLCGCHTAGQMPPALPGNVPVKQLVPEAVEIVQAGLADADPRVRANAIEVVAASRQIKLMPKVCHLLKDNSVPVRFAAAVAIGDIEYSLCKSDVEQLLKDSDENVRIAAAYALKKLDASSDLEPIRKAIIQQRPDGTWQMRFCCWANAATSNDLKLLYWALQNKDSGDKVRFRPLRPSRHLTMSVYIRKYGPCS